MLSNKLTWKFICTVVPYITSKANLVSDSLQGNLKKCLVHIKIVSKVTIVYSALE